MPKHIDTIYNRMYPIIRKEPVSLAIAIFCLIFTVYPAYFGLNAFTMATGLLLSGLVTYLKHIKKSDKGAQQAEPNNTMSIFTFIYQISHNSGHLPWFIGMCAAMCLLSTVAPLTMQLIGVMDAARAGPSKEQFKSALSNYMGYNAILFALNSFAKTTSKNSGTMQASTIQEVSCQGIRSQDTEEKKDTLRSQKKDFIRDAVKICGEYWYFVQTVSQSIINMVASLIAVQSVETTASLRAYKTLLTTRFFAAAIFLNAASYWIGATIVSDAKKDTNAAKKRVSDTIGEENDTEDSQSETQNAIYENAQAQYTANFLVQIQDTFYTGVKSLFRRDTMAYWEVINALWMISFPLTSELDLIIKLSTALSGMIIDFLSVARNLGSWTNATASFESLTCETKNSVKLFENPEALRNTCKQVFKEKEKHFKPIKHRGNQDLVDSLLTLACTLIVSDWAITKLIPSETSILNKLLGNWLQLNLAVSVNIAGLAAIVACGYWIRQYLYVQNNGQEAHSAEIRSQTVERFSSIFCSMSVTGLWVRMVCMFHKSIPDAVLKLTTFGLGEGFIAQMVITAITTFLTMTLFLTPLLRPERAGAERFSTVVKKSYDFMSQVYNWISEMKGCVDRTTDKVVGKAAVALSSELLTQDPANSQTDLDNKYNDLISNKYNDLIRFFSNTYTSMLQATWRGTA